MQKITFDHGVVGGGLCITRYLNSQVSDPGGTTPIIEQINPQLLIGNFVLPQKYIKKLPQKMWIFRPFSWNFSLCDHKLIMLRNFWLIQISRDMHWGGSQRSHWITGGEGGLEGAKKGSRDIWTAPIMSREIQMILFCYSTQYEKLKRSLTWYVVPIYPNFI